MLVDEAERGAVDTEAAARYATADLTVDRTLPGGRAFVRGRFFGESRKNGTPLQTNRTHVNQVVAGADTSGPRLGQASVRIHASAQVYNQSFSAVAADRESEALIREQRVPAQDTGLSAQWSRPLGTRNTLVAGLVGREVRGSSDEVVIASGVATSTVGAGGRERTASAFVEDLWRLHPRVHLTLAARFDHWRRYRALSTTTPVARPGPARRHRVPRREPVVLQPASHPARERDPASRPEPGRLPLVPRADPERALPLLSRRATP